MVKISHDRMGSHVPAFLVALGVLAGLLPACTAQDSTAYVEDMCLIDCTESQACWFFLWRSNTLPDDKDIPVSGATQQNEVEAECRAVCKEFWNGASERQKTNLREAWNACTQETLCEYVACAAPCCLEQACTFSGERAGETCDGDGDTDQDQPLPDGDQDDEGESESSR